MWDMHHCFQLARWDFQVYWRCVECSKVSKDYVIDSLVHRTRLQNGIEATKCWLKTFDSNKVKLFKKEGYISW